MDLCRGWVVLACVAAASCMEPSKAGQVELAVRGLADLHTWDPVRQGQGQYAYDVLMSSDPADVIPALVAHLTDETPTAIHDRILDLRPAVGDVCLLMLLDLTKISWREFLDDGLFISTQLPNPVFCIRWDTAARRRVQARFAKLLGLTVSE
ncbi:MAG: hypothetical protein ACK44W_11720 [Planctomycetota bacterium]